MGEAFGVGSRRTRCRRPVEHTISRRTLIGGAVATVGLAASNAQSEIVSAALRPGSIRFGLTPVFLSNDLKVLDELQAYLTRAIGEEVQLVTQRIYQEVTALLVSGNLEAAWISGYPFMKFRDELELVATPVWRGKPLYQSYLIVGQDRDISARIIPATARGHQALARLQPAAGQAYTLWRPAPTRWRDAARLPHAAQAHADQRTSPPPGTDRPSRAA